MRRRTKINENVTVNGFYVNETTLGFFGEKDEGRQMLQMMGLPVDRPPFSVAAFLQNKKIRWTDSRKNVAHISFKLKPEQIECSGSYLGKRKKLRVFREWDNYEDPSIVAKLESEAIGDLCMRCIYEKLIE